MLRIGTAGWTIRSEHTSLFGDSGTHLTRYAARLNAVEINSSFYKPHRAQSYARWARETPKEFSFAVKMPKRITHELQLAGAKNAIGEFFAQCGGLGEKLGCVLIQLPPSLEFDSAVVSRFLREVRAIHTGAVALEPRHESWFEPAPDGLLARFKIARVAADPLPAKMQDMSIAQSPGGFDGLEYWRLHGSPKIYYANYASDFLDTLAKRLSNSAQSKDVWCVFDNTAVGHATNNALELTAKTKTPRS